MSTAQQLAKLLELSQKDLRVFARLPKKSKRVVASKHLKALGILTAKGTLAAAFA